MAKQKRQRSSGGGSGNTKIYWSFIAVVAAGLAYLAAFLFQQLGAGKVAHIGYWIAALFGLVAWIIVFILGWKRVRQNNIWMVVVYCVCMVMIIVFAFLPVILWYR